MRRIFVVLLALLAAPLLLVAPRADAAGPARYKQAPAPVRALLDAPPTPATLVSPGGDVMLLARSRVYPSIAELAEPMLRLAGERLNPRNNAPHGGFRTYELAVQAIPDGTPQPVALPEGMRIGGLRWNDAGTKVAFLNLTEERAELWVLDIKSARARKIRGVQVNAVLGDALAWLPDDKTLVVKTVRARRGAAPVAPATPTGPTIRESAGAEVASSTYEVRDVLQGPHDAALFDYHATAQLALVDVSTGRARPIGGPGVLERVDVAPGGAHLLVRTLHRPYSYKRAHWRFPARVEVWDLQGAVVERVAEQPLAEEVPIHGARTGPRGYRWRATAPATLTWVEALDGGDSYADVPEHDRLMMKTIGGAPVELLRLRERYGGIEWIEGGGQALVHEIDRAEHHERTLLIDVDARGVAPRVIWDRNWDDRYGDPGAPIYRPLPSGAWAIRKHENAIYLSGRGDTDDGPRPFVDRLALDTLKTERLFRSDAHGVEQYAGALDPVKGTFLTSRESPTEPPNLFLRTVGAPSAKARPGEASRRSSARPITRFEDPAPQLRKVEKRLVNYTRADGVPLSFMLYLPPDYVEGTRLPTVVWAYPLDYTDLAAAGQNRNSPQSFTLPRGASPVMLALAGYAVLSNAAMPVVGPTETAYDTFVEQITANAQAAIDKAVELGVTDRARVGVFGHSHGALMTANLLVWTDLFRAGVARSGAFNHTLRPFGFQNERRTLYQAERTYLGLSPTLHADELDEPLLLIHGELDANPGTRPFQSVKLYEALSGAGKTARLVMLPYEDHGYAARESVEHVLAETIEWFDAHVKRAGPREAKPPRSPGIVEKPEVCEPPAPKRARPARRAKPAPCDRKCERDKRRADRKRQRALRRAARARP